MDLMAGAMLAIGKCLVNMLGISASVMLVDVPMNGSSVGTDALYGGS